MQIGFVGLLQLLFIGLKLGGIITWPWFWVLAPLWMSAIFGCFILLVIITVAMIGTSGGRTMRRAGRTPRDRRRR